MICIIFLRAFESSSVCVFWYSLQFIILQIYKIYMNGRLYSLKKLFYDSKSVIKVSKGTLISGLICNYWFLEN